MYQRYQRYGLLIVSIVGVSLLSACSPVKIPNPNQYQLAPAVPDKKLVSKSSNQSLLISLPQASPAFDTEKMAYVKQAYQVAFFTKNKWVAEPALMLQPLMMQALQNTGYFSVVTSAPFSGYTDLRLDTTLLSLQQNFLTNPSQLEMIIDVRLVRTATQHVIAGQRFTMVVSAPTNTPYGGVQAANEATAMFLQQLDTFMMQLLNRGYIP